MLTRTPHILKPFILEFCNTIVPNQQPLYVPVNPMPDQSINNCFTIVSKHISTHRGEQIFGWSIWEWPKVMIEAEFHTVWRTEDGRLIDISPKEYDVNQILFLPDPYRNYEGRQVNNVRKPLTHDKRIYKFCRLADELFFSLNEGNLAYEHGEIVCTPKMEKIIYDKNQLQIILMRKYG